MCAGPTSRSPRPAPCRPPWLHRGDLGFAFSHVRARPSTLVEGLPLGRHHEGPLRPSSQRHPQIALELLDRLAGRRLGHEVLFGAAGERPKADDIAIEAQRFQMHGESLALVFLIHII